MRRSIAVALLAVAAIATNSFAVVQARIGGKITDSMTKAPIPNATILVVSAKDAPHKFKQEVKAAKDGTYGIYLLDGTMFYDWTWSAPGYKPYTDTFRLDLSKPNVRDIELDPANATAAAAPATAQAPKVDPTVAAFNEGASLANQGKVDEAIAKIEQAVAAKPDLAAGYEALGRLYLRQKNYPKAIENANKAVAIDPDASDMYAVLYDAYTATGQKDKAAEVKPKMPANPGMLFNDAAKLINSGKDAEAEPLLKQAIAADDTFARAYYELGMLDVRLGKNADAKTNLQKYIDLDPKGKDVSTAKEMLKYVQ